MFLHDAAIRQTYAWLYASTGKPTEKSKIPEMIDGTRAENQLSQCNLLSSTTASNLIFGGVTRLWTACVLPKTKKKPIVIVTA